MKRLLGRKQIGFVLLGGALFLRPLAADLLAERSDPVISWMASEIIKLKRAGVSTEVQKSFVDNASPSSSPPTSDDLVALNRLKVDESVILSLIANASKAPPVSNPAPPAMAGSPPAVVSAVPPPMTAPVVTEAAPQVVYSPAPVYYSTPAYSSYYYGYGYNYPYYRYYGPSYYSYRYPAFRVSIGSRGGWGGHVGGGHVGGGHVGVGVGGGAWRPVGGGGGGGGHAGGHPGGGGRHR